MAEQRENEKVGDLNKNLPDLLRHSFDYEHKKNKFRFNIDNISVDVEIIGPKIKKYYMKFSAYFDFFSFKKKMDFKTLISVTKLVENTKEIPFNYKMEGIENLIKDIDNMVIKKFISEYQMYKAESLESTISGLPSQAIKFLTETRKDVISSKNELLDELRKQKIAVEYERLAKTKENPISYRASLLTYNPDAKNEFEEIEKQTLFELYRSKNEIDKRIKELQPKPDENDIQIAKIYFQKDEPTQSEIDEVSKLSQIKEEVINSLKEKGEKILNIINKKQYAPTFHDRKMRSLSQKERLNILKSINV